MTPSVSDPAVESFLADSAIKTEPVAEVKTEPIVVEQNIEPVVEAKAEPVSEVKTEPVVEETKVETPPIDIEKIFSEASNGKVKSAEDLTKILQERDEFKQKADSAPVLDDYTLKLDSWMKKGYEPELFHKINSLPIDEMSAEDTMKVSLSLQNPEWSKEDIDLYVKHTYGLMSEEEEGYNAQTVKVGQLKLQQDARMHEDNLRKLQEMTVYSNADEQEAVRLEGSRQETWKQNLPKLVDSINKIPFILDDKGTTFDYSPTPLQKQAVVAEVQKAILNAPVAFNEAGIKAVSNLIQERFINQNINQILRAAVGQQKSTDTDKTIKEAHNPSRTITPVVTPKVEKSRDDVLFETMEASLSGRR